MKRRWLAIFLLAALVRMAFVWQAQTIYHEPPNDPWLLGDAEGQAQKFSPDLNDKRGYVLRAGFDSPKYVRYARMVMDGQWWAEDPTISPLAPLVSFPLFLILGGGSVFGAMMVQALVGALSLLVLGRIGLRLVSQRAVLLAMIFGALYWPLVLYDSLPLTECTINLTAWFAIWLFLRYREEPTWRRAFVWGMAVGLATAAKPTLIVLLLLLPLGHALAVGRKQNRALNPKWLALAFGATCLMIAPFCVRAHALTGEWLFLRGNTGYMVLMGNRPGATGSYQALPQTLDERLAKEGGSSLAKKDRLALVWSFGWWLDHPAEAVGLFCKKVGMFLSPRESGNNVSLCYLRQITFAGWLSVIGSPLLWTLALIGAGVCWRSKRQWTVVLLWAGGYGLVIAMTIILTRLRLPVLLVPLLLAGAGMEWLYGQGGKLTLGRKWVVIGGLSLVLLLHGSDLRRNIQPTWQPNGFAAETAAGLTFGDVPWQQTIETGVPYGVVLSRSSQHLEKDLRLLGASELQGRPCALWIWAHVKGQGVLRITVDGTTRLVQVPSRPRSELLSKMIPLKIPLTNVVPRPAMTVAIAPGPQTLLRIGLGDGPWFGRTRVLDGPKQITQAQFDPVTLQYLRHAHQPRGEAAVMLVIGE